MTEIALQVLLAVLLIVTIVYAFILNRRLDRLRDGREEMQRLAAELTLAMTSAERGVATLRKTAFEDDEALGKRIAEARTMRDEIGFMVDRAESLSGRLEEQIGAGRPAAAAGVAGLKPAQAPERPVARMADDDDFYGAGNSGNDDNGAAAADIEAARAARATATAWLRNRGEPVPDGAEAQAMPMRGLR